MPAHPNTTVRRPPPADSPRAEPGALRARQLHALVRPHMSALCSTGRRRYSSLGCSGSHPRRPPLTVNKPLGRALRENPEHALSPDSKVRCSPQRREEPLDVRAHVLCELRQVLGFFGNVARVVHPIVPDLGASCRIARGDVPFEDSIRDEDLELEAGTLVMRMIQSNAR